MIMHPPLYKNGATIVGGRAALWNEFHGPHTLQTRFLNHNKTDQLFASPNTPKAQPT